MPSISLLCSEKGDKEHHDPEPSETDVTTDVRTSHVTDELVSTSPSTSLTTIQEDSTGSLTDTCSSQLVRYCAMCLVNGKRLFLTPLTSEIWGATDPKLKF